MNMNRMHRRLCASRRWADYVRTEVLPAELDAVDLGDDLLEVGPGPGVTSDLLHRRAPRFTAIELDEALAAELGARLSGEHVEIVNGDATRMPFASDRFSAAVCFTMLHHVPTDDLQDRLFREVQRVLRPGAPFIGSDSNPGRSLAFKLLHIGDVSNLVDPDTLGGRLERAGFHSVEVGTRPGRLWWRAAA